MGKTDNALAAQTYTQMYELRDYQRQAVDVAVNFFQTGNKKNGIIVLPTGAGKSLVIANIAYRLDAPVLIFQPSKEILEQNKAERHIRGGNATRKKYKGT